MADFWLQHFLAILRYASTKNALTCLFVYSLLPQLHHRRTVVHANISALFIATCVVEHLIHEAVIMPTLIKSER
jgi:hypothetical protein